MSIRRYLKAMVLNNAVYRKLDIEMSLNNIKLTANCFALTHPENEKNLFKYILEKCLNEIRSRHSVPQKSYFYRWQAHLFKNVRIGRQNPNGQRIH